MRRREMRARPVDIFKQLKIQRKDEDVDGDDDTDSSLRRSDKPAFERKKEIIPIPVATKFAEKQLELQELTKWTPPTAYIRHSPQFLIEGNRDGDPEYVLEKEDEDWLRSQQFLAGKCKHVKNEEKGAKKKETESEKQRKQDGKDGAEGDARKKSEPAKEEITLDQMEYMITMLEQATGNGPLVSEERASALFEGLMGMSAAVHRDAWKEVYLHWQQKRQRRKHALLRRYWPLTDLNDSDPHRVFRPRHKEKYKLRKKKGSDVDSLKRMQQLRKDFQNCTELLEKVLKRERLKAAAFDAQEDMFEQILHDLTNKTGESRKPKVQIEVVENSLLAPKQILSARAALNHPPPADRRISPDGTPAFETSTILPSVASVKLEEGVSRPTRPRTSKPKKPKPKLERGISAEHARATALTDGMQTRHGGRQTRSERDRARTPQPQQNIVVEAQPVLVSRYEPYRCPLPNFMDHMDTRDDFSLLPATVDCLWDDYDPYNYDDEASKKPIKYRCRGRIGRGGRVLFDRIPVMDYKDREEEDTPIVLQAGPYFPSQATNHPPIKSVQPSRSFPKINYKKFMDICSNLDDVEDNVSMEPLETGAGVDYDLVPIPVMNRRIRYVAIV